MTAFQVTDLQYEVHGEGERTFVWGHGLTGSRRADDESGLFAVVEPARAAGWRVVRYDARGHGESPAPQDEFAYRWERLADDMLAVADTVGAERFVAGGASMGCATSLYAALRAPERIEALVLAIPPTAWDTRAGQGELYLKSASIIRERGLAKLLKLNAALPPTTMFGEEGKRRSLHNLGAMDERALPFVFAGAAASDLPDLGRLATLTMPTLVLAWDGDPGHPVSTAEILDDVIPNAELRIAKTPDEVLGWGAQVGEFLSRL